MVSLSLLKIFVELLVACALGTSPLGRASFLLRLIGRLTRTLSCSLGLPVELGADLLKQVLIEALLVDF